MGAPATERGVEFVGAFAVSLAMTYIILPWLIPKLKQRGIVGRDLNKPGQPEVAEMGGIAVVVGFFSGVSALIALDGIANPNLLNVSFSAILGAAFVGMMDDIFDLKQRHKALLPFVLALPLGTVVDPNVVIPHVTTINFGSYMVLAAAIAVTCAANAANMLEGFNGLGTGLGIIMSITLMILSIVHDRLDGMYLLVPLVGALVAFLWFNQYPAQVFPGDTMTLFMGATLATAGILSTLHVQTFFIFLPMIIEFFLKLRGSFGGENYCTGVKDGYLVFSGKVESLTHLLMKRMKLRESQLVYIVWSIEVVLCAVVLVVDVSL